MTPAQKLARIRLLLCVSFALLGVELIALLELQHELASPACPPEPPEPLAAVSDG